MISILYFKNISKNCVIFLYFVSSKRVPWVLQKNFKHYFKERGYLEVREYHIITLKF